MLTLNYTMSEWGAAWEYAEGGREATLFWTQEAFERGTNVQFARAVEPGAVEALVWERGAGETLASGSSACAVAAAAMRQGLVSERAIEVRMPGGTLRVSIDEEWRVTLLGPVEDVCTGTLTPRMLRRLQGEEDR